MANIRENVKCGKIVSYRFTVCLERDANQKQIRRYYTWAVPQGLSVSKARKAAERAADKWEHEVREEYDKQKTMGLSYVIPVEKRQDSFTTFVNFLVSVVIITDMPCNLPLKSAIMKHKQQSYAEIIGNPIAVGEMRQLP